MLNIKRFFDRVSALDQNPGKSLVIPVQEARLLRDEIIKLMADKLETREQQTASASDVIQIEITGGTF
jgi:hypothetical protein